MTTPNAELAYRVLDHIDANRNSWDQGVWLRQTECGTAGCFAGWTVLLAGHRVEFGPTDPRAVAEYASIDGHADASVSDLAADDLGISESTVPCPMCDTCGVTEWASRELFAPGNDRARLGELVEEIFGPRPAATS